MTNYVAWTPKYDGHAPPYWAKGMLAHKTDNGTGIASLWLWIKGDAYYVPPEAVNPPFDAGAWLEQGRANADKLPDGVVLPDAPDWADKLVVEWYKSPVSLRHYIRKHCRPIGDVK